MDRNRCPRDEEGPSRVCVLPLVSGKSARNDGGQLAYDGIEQPASPFEQRLIALVRCGHEHDVSCRLDERPGIKTLQPQRLRLPEIELREPHELALGPDLADAEAA